jgi:hypothetical protein
LKACMMAACIYGLRKKKVLHPEGNVRQQVLTKQQQKHTTQNMRKQATTRTKHFYN